MTNRAWVQNTAAGALGLGVANTTIYRTPQLMASAPDFVEIAFSFPSGGAGIGRTAAGTVYVWGPNTQGLLGDGTTDSSAHHTPVQVTALSDIVRVESVGSHNFAALDSSGDLYGWGENAGAELGLGDTTRRTTPTLITTGVTGFAGGGSHLVVLKSGVVQTVGRNVVGQLGVTTNNGSQTPVTAWQTVTPGSGTVVGVSAISQTTYLLMADATVMACGRGAEGELGFMPTPFPSQAMPTIAAVPNLSSVVLIGSGNLEAFFKLSDDTVWSLGSNQDGVLGCGQTFAALNHTTTAPVQVILPSGVTFSSFGKAVTGGSPGADACMIALGSDHQAYTWGTGASGQMGDGGNTETNHTPVSANGLVYVNVVGGGATAIFAEALDTAPSTGRSFVSIIG